MENKKANDNESDSESYHSGFVYKVGGLVRGLQYENNIKRPILVVVIGFLCILKIIILLLNFTPV